MDIIGKIKDMWNSYAFEIVLCSCILFLVIYALIRWCKRERGTWSTSYYRTFDTNQPQQKKEKKDSSGETECRRVLEKIFRRPFKKIRPDFLRNPVTSFGNNNINLEIDCYNSDLKLGVEYNGAQHYKYIPYFHKNHEAFMNQKYRDVLKNQFCKNEGILLIEVPYTTKVKDIEGYIINELMKNGYKF